MFLKKVTIAVSVVGATLVGLSGCAIQPQPFNRDDITSFAQSDQREIMAQQEPINAPVTLAQAIARAIKYNLDARISVMEEALSRNELSMAKMGLLPSVVASAGYTWRSNPDSSNSHTVGGTDSPSYTYSDQTNTRNADLTLTWNILDFGVSYYQANQQADRQTIAGEKKRRVLQNLIMEVRSTYWRAAAASIMQARVDTALENARTALTKLQQVIDERVGDPLDAYRGQKALLETIVQLDSIREDMESAKPSLSSLMGLRPGTPFTLAATAEDTFRAPAFNLPLETLEQAAVQLRPELREAAYEERISLLETKKAFARMFPGLELSAGLNYTSNRFKEHGSWRSAGSFVTWNLFNLLTGPAQMEMAEAQKDISHLRRLSLSLAVLTQLHVAYRNHHAAIRQYDYAKRLWVLSKVIAKHTRQSEENKSESLLEKMRTEINEVQTEMRFFEAYSGAQNGLARIYASLGLDPLPETLEDTSVEGLAKAVASTLTDWEKGVFPWVQPEGADAAEVAQ
ncbi:MAG: TolC family protein [Sedimenticola sp.]